ncbi:hypothetical protein [Tissierella praeacuta]|uniref:hypothetical protein n=1 Tax=Tissierella praeacuta TaxID=43131 RepID=UPI00333E29A0
MSGTYMNNIELKRKVWSSAGDILKERNYISPVDLLMKLGVLSYQDYENWRFHRIPYLEKVCKTNLSKLSLIMKELKAYAGENQLKASWTAYYQWGVKGKKTPLHFSKYGEPNIEEAYATHFVLMNKGDTEAL